MRVDLGLNAVIVAVTAEVPRILTVARPGRRCRPEDALPFGPLEPETDRTLDLGLRRWVREQTGLELGYVEQLYTFGDRYRDPRETQAGRAASPWPIWRWCARSPSTPGARWRDWYEFFPWEDWRSGRPEVIDRSIAPALDAWVADGPDRLPRLERRQRADIVFGLGGVGWDGERVLERYELLYEAYLVPEAWRDREATGGAAEARRPAPARGRSCCPAAPWRSTTGASWPPRSAGCGGSSNTGPWSSSCCRRPSPCCSSSGWSRRWPACASTSRTSAGWSRTAAWSKAPAVRTPRPAAVRPSCSSSAARCCASARRPGVGLPGVRRG